MTQAPRNAVILLSGGLDSATVLGYALEQGFRCFPLAFRYGQRHSYELECAQKISAHYQLPLKTAVIDLTLWGGSALTDPTISVPDAKDVKEKIPLTYVPARNLIFLSFAAAYAETLSSTDLFIGVNSIDYSGYPDCRPDFIEAFRQTVKLATRTADTAQNWMIHAPLQHLSKAEIIRLADNLKVPLELTHSCYNPTADNRSCGKCDACTLRRNGFLEAGVPDPTRY